MSKRDRQGVRTPAQLEQKYSFGNDQKAVREMRALAASFAREAAEMRAQMAKMQSELDAVTVQFVLAAIVEVDGAWSLSGTTYTKLKESFDGGSCIALYADAGGGRRYYYCMGVDSTAALVFQYGFDGTVQYATVGANGSVSVGDVQ